MIEFWRDRPSHWRSVSRGAALFVLTNAVAFASMFVPGLYESLTAIVLLEIVCMPLWVGLTPLSWLARAVARLVAPGAGTHVWVLPPAALAYADSTAEIVGQAVVSTILAMIAGGTYGLIAGLAKRYDLTDVARRFVWSLLLAVLITATQFPFSTAGLWPRWSVVPIRALSPVYAVLHWMRVPTFLNHGPGSSEVFFPEASDAVVIQIVVTAVPIFLAWQFIVAIRRRAPPL